MGWDGMDQYRVHPGAVAGGARGGRPLGGSRRDQDNGVDAVKKNDNGEERGGQAAGKEADGMPAAAKGRRCGARAERREISVWSAWSAPAPHHDPCACR